MRSELVVIGKSRLMVTVDEPLRAAIAQSIRTRAVRPRVRIMAEVGSFSLPRNAQSGFGAHAATFLVGKR